MNSEISCPRCNQPVLSQNRYCEHCGVNLAMAAVMAEQVVVLPGQLPSGVRIAPEILVPRMGEYMIEEGLLKPEELQKALDYQKEHAVGGNPILLGQALLELNLVGREMLDHVITMQIMNLQTALNEANQNLTERVAERTQELQRALERLSELNQLKTNFIANISHELRTPLTHIKGYLDILSECGLGPLTPSQSEALDVLKRAEERLERLIEDLIQFSLASRGELSLSLDEVEIGRLIQASIDRSTYKAKPQEISLTSIIPDNLPSVRADEEKIGWVLLQLIDNAIKFTSNSGKVVVKATVDNGLIAIAVMDTGIGIPQNRFTEIFEPFHQLDGNSTRRYAGTGLGLAMVRRIIEAHGSQIQVQSVVGKGTRFEFSLSAIKAAPKENADTQTGPETS